MCQSTQKYLYTPQCVGKSYCISFCSGTKEAWGKMNALPLAAEQGSIGVCEGTSNSSLWPLWHGQMVFCQCCGWLYFSFIATVLF